jgi:hypothetical protein
VIRDTIAKMNMVAIGRVVLKRREHIIALETRGRGLVGLTLRYPYEVRDEKLYFDDIPEVKLPKDMLDLAAHIVETKSGHFDPAQFEDQTPQTRHRLSDRVQANTAYDVWSAGKNGRKLNHLLSRYRPPRSCQRKASSFSRSIHPNAYLIWLLKGPSQREARPPAKQRQHPTTGLKVIDDAATRPVAETIGVHGVATCMRWRCNQSGNRVS